MMIAIIILITAFVVAIGANIYAWIKHFSLSKVYQKRLQHLNFDAMQYGLNQHDLALSNTIALSEALVLFSKSLKDNIIKLSEATDSRNISAFLLELSRCIHPNTSITGQFDLISYENALAINKYPEIAVKLLCSVLLQQSECKDSLSLLCSQAVHDYQNQLKSLERHPMLNRLFHRYDTEVAWRMVPCAEGLR